jgi:hypothetical protein
MTPASIDRLLGLPRDVWTALSSLVVYVERGEGPEVLGAASTMSEVFRVIAEQTLPGGIEQEPDFAQMDSEGFMERISEPGKLVYLASVLEQNPGQRLVVAWEAVPPAQDSALGIFTGG